MRKKTKVAFLDRDGVINSCKVNRGYICHIKDFKWIKGVKKTIKFFGYSTSLGSKSKVYFLQPHTFMNNSGKAVQAFAKFHKIKVEEILVIHDELDIIPGKIKLKLGGGHGGHNGIKDITQLLGSNNFWRLKNTCAGIVA